MAEVGPLSLPDPNGSDPSGVSQYEAVSLFLERAKATVPQFALQEGNRTAALQRCLRLDGVPLAIELAALRARHDCQRGISSLTLAQSARG